MSEPAPGTAQNPEHVQPGTQEQPQHATQQPAPSQAPSPQQQPAAQPGQAPTVQPTQSFEQLQQQLEQERTARQQYEDRYKHLQGAFTQTRQQLASLTGQQPAQDPLAPYVEQLVKQGYDEKDARAIAGVSHSMIAPLQQQLATSHAAMQNQSMVEDVLRSVYQQDQQTLSDPEVWQAVEQNVRQEALNAAQNGQPWDPQYAQQYALNVAWQTAGNLRLQRASRGTQQPPAQQQPFSPFMRGATGIPGNFTPAPAQQQPTVTRTAEQSNLQAELNRRMGKQ